jgi:SAM-dependent methyltransferase
LREGAECAVGVDLSERMIAIARQESRAEGFAVRTSYHQGDFTHVADRLADADVTVLDKVICCYPDRGRLVDPSIAKTRQRYAFSIPHDRALTRIGLGAMRWALKGDGCCYRPFLYDPAMIGGRLAANGFHASWRHARRPGSRGSMRGPRRCRPRVTHFKQTGRRYLHSQKARLQTSAAYFRGFYCCSELLRSP